MLNMWSCCTWSSPDHPDVLAVELLAPTTGGETLARAFDRLHQRACSFLIVRVDSIKRDGIGDAVAAFFDRFETGRLCLAGNRDALASLPDRPTLAEEVALMLDEVDERTALADIAWDQVEAVRFKADFVERAGRSMRLGLVLDAMLRLGNGIGVSTFNASRRSSAARVAERFKFDYSLSERPLPLKTSVHTASTIALDRAPTPR